jgi:hypothetical protein
MLKRNAPVVKSALKAFTNIDKHGTIGKDFTTR